MLLEQSKQERKQRVAKLRMQEERDTLEALRQAHWLKCPKCGHDMKTRQLEGIEIDQCTFCEGLYFDHGELDNLMLKKKSERFKFYRRFFGLD